MNIYVLLENFQTAGIVDSYESFLWVDKYNAFGDFEIFTNASIAFLQLMQENRYLWFSESDRLMIIEEREIITDTEIGARLYIRGRSLESILERRIVWTQTILTGNFQNAVQRLLNENVIAPTDQNRKIPGFIFKPSTDPRITSLVLVSAQFTGDSLYEAIKALCVAFRVGFKIVLTEANLFEFSLFIGEDRSYDQLNNPYVIFGPDFDNILNSNYFETNRAVRTVALVAGEGEGIERRTTTTGGGAGLSRRELFVDARDISSDIDGGKLSDTEYTAQLVQRGNEKLSDYFFIKTFEGEMETTQSFVYKEDFFLGDIVQVRNEFNVEARCRIVEIIFSHNAEALSIVPTFQIEE